MVRGTPEAYLEWLEREERSLGIARTVEASLDMEKAKALLWSELRYEPTEEQLSAFMGAGFTRYEALPQIGISFSMIEHKWGWEASFRDIMTGRFVKPADVWAALETAGF